jgi:hypothetical protein
MRLPTKSNHLQPRTNQSPLIPVVKVGVFLLYWNCITDLCSLEARREVEMQPDSKVQKRHLTRFQRYAILYSAILAVQRRIPGSRADRLATHFISL